jgi:hypothetical protein
LNCAGGHIEPLGDILANAMLETATARAGFIRDIDDDLFARQMRRQFTATVASPARQSRRLVAVLLLTGFRRSECLFQILECERQLIGSNPFGPAAEAVALQFLDDGDQALDLATSSGELVGMPLSLGQQQSPQSVRIGREVIKASRHSAMESHPRRFVAVELAPESPCRGLQRRVRRRYTHTTHPRPIKTFEKSRELSRTEPHHTVADRRPPERSLFQPLGDQHEPGAVPEQQLHAIRALGPEDVDNAAIRIGTKALAHHCSKSVHAFTKIDRLRRDQYLHAAGGDDHEAAFTARRTSFSIAASTPGGMRMVAAPITTSMVATSVPASGTGADTTAPGASVSSTTRALSSSENRRRLSVPVITSSRRTGAASGSSVWSSVDTS